MMLHLLLTQKDSFNARWTPYTKHAISVQPNHKPEEGPSHVSRNCNPTRNQCQRQPAWGCQPVYLPRTHNHRQPFSWGRAGHHIYMDKSASWMSSTFDVCVKFWEYPGKTKSHIMRSLAVPVSIFIHLTPPAPLTMALTRTSDGVWPYSKRPAVWWTGHRVQRQRSSPPSLQRHLQVGYEGPKMDYTNWESMADNRSAWKLSSSLIKGELALKETSE